MNYYSITKAFDYYKSKYFKNEIDKGEFIYLVDNLISECEDLLPIICEKIKLECKQAIDDKRISTEKLWLNKKELEGFKRYKCTNIRERDIFN